MRGVTEEAWKEAIFDQNVLQVSSAIAVRRSARILRARLEPLGKGLWEMVRDGSRELATQATFAGALRDSRLIGDFLDITVREQRALFATKLERHIWNEYIAGCRGRDPDMPHWSDATMAKLRSMIFGMLAEVGYLKSARSLELQNVFVDAQLASYLRERGETYVLRCMEVAE
jgi:hypothetical protein